jgi:hypothetical protein
MKTNTFNKLMAIALLCVGAAFTPTAAKAAYTTQIKVISKPYSAAPGTRVQVLVSLGYQDPKKGNAWVPLAGRRLGVDGAARSSFVTNTIPIRDVVTNNGGLATITFTMPPRNRNQAGGEVGTVLDLSVTFRGEAPNLKAKTTSMHIVVQ